MNADEMRAIQAPLKERYRADPKAALITLRASGALDSAAIACKVETGRALAVAGLHPATGGSGAELCSGDMLLEALVACAGVTLKAVATSMGVELRSGEVTAEGDLDFRGTLGVDKQAAGRLHRHPAQIRTRHGRAAGRSSTRCSSSPSAIASCCRRSNARLRSKRRSSEPSARRECVWHVPARPPLEIGCAKLPIILVRIYRHP